MRGDQAWANAVKAVVLMQMKRYADALPYAQKAIALRPQMFDRKSIKDTGAWTQSQTEACNLLYIGAGIRACPSMAMISLETTRLFEPGDYVIRYDNNEGWDRATGENYSGLSGIRMYMGWNTMCNVWGLTSEQLHYVAAECLIRTGHIGLSQNMELLLAVAEEFQSSKVSEVSSSNDSETGEAAETQKPSETSNIQFVLVGEGAALENVKRTIAEKNLDNVHLLPFQPYEDISHVFSLGDVSLVISKPGTGAASVPSKTWSIMSASRPVLANFDENELKDIVEKNRCGIFTKAGDKEAFKEAILRLYRDRDLCQEYGRNGRQFVMNNLTREVGTRKYVDVIKSVVKD